MDQLKLKAPKVLIRSFLFMYVNQCSLTWESSSEGNGVPSEDMTISCSKYNWEKKTGFFVISNKAHAYKVRCLNVMHSECKVQFRKYY